MTDRRTKYGQKEQHFSRVEKGVGYTTKIIGGAMRTGGIIGSMSGEPMTVFGGIALYGAGHLVDAAGQHGVDIGRRRGAHATAVESLIAKKRGGSVALGQHGIVPHGPEFKAPTRPQSKADRMRAGASHLGGPKPVTDYRTGKGIPGPDGISPAAREISRDPHAMQDAMQSAFDNNPELKAQLEKEAAGGNAMSKSLLDGTFPKGEADIQRSFDAIHKGSGGKSNGMGQVWKGDGPPPSAADRMRDGAMHLGAPVAAASRAKTNAPAPAAPAPAAPQSRIQKKYSGARTKVGARVMDKAREARSSSKLIKGAGHVASVGGFAFGPAGGIVGLGTGIGMQVVGVSKARQAEDLRMKSRGLDNLITRHRTGSTVGANTTGMQHDWTPTEKRTSAHISFGFNAANALFGRKKAAAAKAQQDSGGSGGKRKGWSDAARIGAAKARGVQNLPYGGTPTDGNGDGTGQ